MLTVYLILVSFVATDDRCPDWVCAICVIITGLAIGNSFAQTDYGASVVMYILVILRLRFGRRWYD